MANVRILLDASAKTIEEWQPLIDAGQDYDPRTVALEQQWTALQNAALTVPADELSDVLARVEFLVAEYDGPHEDWILTTGLGSIRDDLRRFVQS